MKMITVNGKQILCADINEWKQFVAWVENTSLFHAIKSDPYGTEIVAQDGSFRLELTGKVEKAEQLPIPVLYNFYINSPFFNKGDNLSKTLTYEN